TLHLSQFLGRYIVVILDLNDGINQAPSTVKQPILLFQNSKTDLVWTTSDDDFYKNCFISPRIPGMKATPD
ncbi:MAG: hypothetical protein OQK71_09035, partial [Desulfobacter sp.]|nr:hypothetical protein [Desulfobacter sp.]